jgi:tetratricopeptide (TPR) repeat protein
LLRILQVEPTNSLAYNNLGMIQMRKKKPLDAIPYLERSYTLNQEAPEVALNLGIAYEQTLSWGKSVAAYEHYLKLANPNGGLSKDKVINAVKFRMQRLKAFARAQGTLDQGLDPSKVAKSEKQLGDEDDSEETVGDLPLASGPVVDPNPIQQPKGNGAAATEVAVPAPTAAPGKERAPAGLQTKLPTDVRGAPKGDAKP